MLVGFISLKGLLPVLPTTVSLIPQNFVYFQFCPKTKSKRKKKILHPCTLASQIKSACTALHSCTPDRICFYCSPALPMTLSIDFS